MGTARLWPGSREALAAKRVDANHRAHHVAVDIGIAHPDLPENVPGETVDTAVHPEREPVTGGIDLAYHVVDVPARIANDMEYRAENLLG